VFNINTGLQIKIYFDPIESFHLSLDFAPQYSDQGSLGGIKYQSPSILAIETLNGSIKYI